MKIRSIAVMMSLCLLVMVGCGGKQQDPFDPEGYAEQGYYGMTLEEVQSRIPNLEQVTELAYETTIEETERYTYTIRYVFQKNIDRLIMIVYSYNFYEEEMCEEKFMEWCNRLLEMDTLPR